MKICMHNEGRFGATPIKNKTGEVVDAHNCDYVNAREKLIPHAEAIARREVGRQQVGGPAADMVFSRAFSVAMDRLAVDAGLTKPTPTMLAQQARAAA